MECEKMGQLLSIIMEKTRFRAKLTKAI